jgi:hypothetical protein
MNERRSSSGNVTKNVNVLREYWGRHCVGQRRQHLEAEFSRDRLARRLRRVGIGMVGAHVDEFRLAGLALRPPVLGRPGQLGAQRIRIARAVEEIVRRRLGLAADAFGIGQRRGVGGGSTNASTTYSV